jgi:hypothetical protein
MTKPTPAVAAAPAPKVPKKRVRLTPRQWAEIETLYASGDGTASALAKKYGISYVYLHRRMRKKGIKPKSTGAAVAAATAEAMTKALVDDSAVIAARIKETKDQHYQMASGLAKLVWAEILFARNEKAPVSSVAPNIKTLQVAMTALKQAREERFAVLGLDRADAVDPSEVPVLEVTELTEEEMALIRANEDPLFTTDGLPMAPAAAADPKPEEGVVEEGHD